MKHSRNKYIRGKIKYDYLMEITNNIASYSDRKALDKKDKILSSKKKKMLWIFIPLIAVLLLGLVILLVFILRKKPNPQNKLDQENSESKSDEKEEEENPKKPTDQPKEVKYRKLEKEFEVVTTAGELRRISVKQKSSDETKMNGKTTSINVTRKTKYDIYIISEEEADEENKLFYSKMYTAAISIVSECSIMGEDNCQPLKLVDLTAEKKSNTNNVRILNNEEDFKDLPIPLCLFNITDNNFITSITCPESYPETKKNEILLDLYFFRPPTIERADKENDNITITINKDIDNNRTYIRELNGGPCNIFNNFGSLCTTDMNTTTDLEGHLIRYDEYTVTNIQKDENNGYIKNKETHLVDETDNINNLDAVKYKNSLEKLLPKLKPYMKEDIQFNSDNFTDLYNIVHKKEKLILKKKRTPRNLFESAILDSQNMNEAKLFHYEDPGGIEVNYNLANNPGLGEESLKLYSKFLFDNETRELVYLSQYSNISYIIDKLSILSKAGNSLATELYNNLKGNLNNMTDDISMKIAELNTLIKYYDLSAIFGATLSLSSVRNFSKNIIEESNNLVNKLTSLYNGIKTGNIRDIADTLNLLVHNYILNSHSLIKKIFDNLKELGNSLKSINNKLTEITTYYLNYTSSSYVEIVEKAQNILEKYYINEKNYIFNQLEQLFNEFENSINSSLENEINTLNILYENLENKTNVIETATEAEYNQLKENLYNSKNYIFNIVKKIKDYIIEEIGLKDNDYFITQNELTINNNSYSYVVSESKEISRKLDNDEYIDKIFDNIMKSFRQNYTNIINYMEKEKFQQFVQDEDVLKDSLFGKEEKTSIENRMENLRSTIINKINEENNYYLDNLHTNISKFMNDDLIELNNIISDLDIIYFSETSLKGLSNLFEEAFDSSLKTILDDIKSNELLAKTYISNLYNVINNNNYLLQLLSSYKLNEIPSRYNNRDFKKFIDYITSKLKTNGYLNKYNQYIANFEYSKTYIENQLFLDLSKEYKPIISKLREKLQIIKSIKIIEKYPDFKELNFFNNHIKIIDDISSRINEYFSDDKFNTKYLNRINEEKLSFKNYINSIENNINIYHNIINKLNLNGDNVNDFCVEYKRKLCYGCTNCAWNYYVYDTYCFPLSSDIKNNHLLLKKSDIKDDKKLIDFKTYFENYLQKISEKIDTYSTTLTNFDKKLNLVKEDTLNRKITNNYLKPFENWVNSILSEKYSDALIRTLYNYYQNIIDNRLMTILNSVSTKWIECFDNLISEVDNNFEDFKSTTYEFGIMAQAYETLISQNLSQSYYESIVSFQKNEFNYTITYYYNYFIKVVTEAYKYAVSNIPINENGFRDILLERKNEINETFSNFIKNITNSLNEALSIKRQKYILLISEDDFFNIGSKFADILISTGQALKSKYLILYDYDTIGDEFSVVSRYYLENSESGKQINQFYSVINENTFVDLNLYKFKDLLLNNWIFDKNDFISKLNESLLNMTKDIEKDLAIKNETNSEILENEIKNILKDSIDNKINNFFLSEIKDLDQNNINLIKTNINEILNKIKEILNSESNRLRTSSTSYNSNYLKINETLKDYKTKIFNELNSTIFSVLDGFYENMKTKVYKNYMETGLNDYIKEAKKETSTNEECKEYHLLNSFYNIGKIIDENLESVVNRYKDKTQKTINHIYQQNYERIKKLINLDEIKENINNIINNSFSNDLLPALNTFAIYNPEISEYSQYDLSNEYKDQINQIYVEKMANIKNIILLTKGSNYEVDIYLYSWERMSFSSVSYKVVRPICKSLYKYFYSEKISQDSELDNIIQKRIYSNFDDLLNNVIPTFGEQFFKRIIKYNEDFKISALYNNIRFSLSETLLYYISLKLCADVDALPKDLKIRLFNLNDLDLTISENNNKILELLEKKTNEFIIESRLSIINKYNSFLINDDEISEAFNSEVLKKINDSLIVTNPINANNYKIMLEKYLKEKLIASYTNLMNDKTNEIINFVNEKKVTLKSKLSSLFSLDSDQVLIDINTKINNTLEAIKNYDIYFKSFEIPKNINESLSNYGKLYIQPNFKNLNTILIKASKDKIVGNLNENSRNIENLSSEQFISQINDNLRFFNTNYAKNFTDSINTYGTNDYSEHLIEKMKNKTERLRRRLEGSQTEQEKSSDSRDNIIDQGIEQNFRNLLNSINDLKIKFNTLEEFNLMDKKINDVNQKLNEKYKESKSLIQENDFEDDIKNYLNEKLTNLSNISKDYYNRINESYYQLKNYLKKMIEDFDNSINNCANITYKIFNGEFDKIVNNTNTFDVSYSESIPKVDTIDPYYQKPDHKLNMVNSSVTDLKEFGQFKFDIKYQNDSLKRLIIVADIINRSRPNKANVDIIYPFSKCGKVVNNLDIQFYEANYTTNIYYDSKENIINLTMYTFFEKYNYYYTSYLYNATDSLQEADTGDISMNIPIKCKYAINKTLVPRNGTEVDQIKNTSFLIINT